MSGWVQLSWWPLMEFRAVSCLTKQVLVGAHLSITRRTIVHLFVRERYCNLDAKLISLDWPNSNFVRQLFCRPPSQNAAKLLTNALQRFEQSQSHPDCGYVSTFNVSRFVSLVKSGRNKQNVFLSSICTLCAWSSAKVATHTELETETKSCND